MPDLRPNSSRPAERLFLAILKGDTPETNPVSAIVVGWISEWLAAHSEATKDAPAVVVNERLV